ncbi:hypothetical protein FPRO05_14014 [Fusarium proliferatum]|uniref:Uncharacterized protein n=1 Tax=Gibberella intermedia TaxID=948311 RepID=A0A365MWF6_GIBIN|nr:hypothetical protein FPRO05_14014 [Fusarium proliferatum]
MAHEDIRLQLPQCHNALSRAVSSPTTNGNKRPLPDSSELPRTETAPRITPIYDDRNRPNDQQKRPRLDRGSPSDVPSRDESSNRYSPLRRPPVPRTPGRLSSPSTQERQNRPSSNLRRDSQYPDRWDGDGEFRRRCPPRGFREDTVEFDEMSTRRQNQLIRTQNRTLLEKIEELGPRLRS